MYSRRGLLGCSMDFVTLHYQFSNIEFYEPNALQQEPHIKMLACFLHQMWLSSCFCLLDCLHLLFLWQNLHPDSGLFLLLFPLATACDTALHLRWWPPTACSKPNHDSHITDCAFAVSFFFFFSFFFFCHNKSLKESWRMTSPWTRYSQLDKSISYIVCRNRFSVRAYLCKYWKRVKLLSNIKDAISPCHDKQYLCGLSFLPLSVSSSYASCSSTISPCTRFLSIHLFMSPYYDSPTHRNIRKLMQIDKSQAEIVLNNCRKTKKYR